MQLSIHENPNFAFFFKYAFSCIWFCKQSVSQNRRDLVEPDVNEINMTTALTMMESLNLKRDVWMRLGFKKKKKKLWESKQLDPNQEHVKANYQLLPLMQAERTA